MRIAWLILALLAIAAPVRAQQAPPTDPMPSAELPPALDRVLRDYEQAWEARDAEALAALFTKDGFVLRPGHPPVRGRRAIEKAYQNAGGPLHLRALAFEYAGTVAYIIGGYRANPEGPDSGKFVLTLRKMQDGQWLITADMDNQNR